ncbi:uncharacterized protein BHQ10_010362 [Talaromyces amestolkiae]|uniref:Amidohydrolase-related domain-containing protein n=1 Tax=Talaromyces amestolkiae TaxID=1196081 RepID=A0A364LEV3_TALAM|nr:uncharacterized protein BHQ10_010362 [Talaromyces amestolkiae]RAO74350.1 hypothetical protein BHQ10_010362 [Talaromyces amestolkiae]
MKSKNSKIDVHAHFVPPCWQDALRANGLEHPDGMPAIPAWDVQSHVQLMDAVGIEKSYLSITSPGVHLAVGDNASARKLARECNTFAYNLKREMPDRFGSFVSLPLPDLEGSINELQYAVDNLEADGVVLQTNYYEGWWYLSIQLPPVRKVVEPTKIFLFLNTQLQFLNSLPHAGGALPPLIHRFSEATALIPDLGLDASMTPSGVRALLNERFWFDTAGPTFPNQIKSLLQYIKPERICYGTDFPFTPFRGVNHLNEVMEENLSFIFDNEADREGMYRGNASRLLGNESSHGISG